MRLIPTIEAIKAKKDIALANKAGRNGHRGGKRILKEISWC